MLIKCSWLLYLLAYVFCFAIVSSHPPEAFAKFFLYLFRLLAWKNKILLCYLYCCSADQKTLMFLILVQWTKAIVTLFYPSLSSRLTTKCNSSSLPLKPVCNCVLLSIKDIRVRLVKKTICGMGSSIRFVLKLFVGLRWVWC